MLQTLVLLPQDQVRLEAAQHLFFSEPQEPWQDHYQVLFRHFSVHEPLGTATILLAQPKKRLGLSSALDVDFAKIMDRWVRAVEAKPLPDHTTINNTDRDAVVVLQWPPFIDMQHPDELELLRYGFVEAIKLTLDMSYNQSYDGLTYQEATTANQWCQLLCQLLAL